MLHQKQEINIDQIVFHYNQIKRHKDRIGVAETFKILENERKSKKKK